MATAAAAGQREVRLMSTIQHDRSASVACRNRSCARRPAARGRRSGGIRAATHDRGAGKSCGKNANPLDLDDVYGLRALRPLLRLVGDLRPLRKRAVAVSGDPGEVDEQVTPTIVGRDEAEALVVAEPLDGTC